METTFLSLLPPLIAIGMAIITRKVLLSLGAGIVAAGLILSQLNIGEFLLSFGVHLQESLLIVES